MAKKKRQEPSPPKDEARDASPEAGPRDPLELAIPVSTRVQIQDVFLRKCRSNYDRNAFESDAVILLAAEKGKPTVRVHDDRKEFIVTLPLRIVGNLETPPNGTIEALTIEAVYEITYWISDTAGLESENYEGFALTNGFYNIWPYWREFVHSMTTRMGIPTIVVPVFRIQ